MPKTISFLFRATLMIIFLTVPIFCDDSSSQAVKDQNQPEKLSFQKAHIVQVNSGQQRRIQINLQEISRYITDNNEQKVISNFLLQYKSVVRSATISLSIFVKNQHKDRYIPRNFTLFNHSEFQQLNVFKLDFLTHFEFSHIQRIVICINSNSFSVISLALLNNQIPFQVDLTEQNLDDRKPFGLIPVWMPFSYDLETEKVRHIIKYVYFRAGQISKELKITRVKGHPKVFLYNCQTDRIDFCKDQIKDEHVEGTLMFQKSIQISLSKQNNCADCLILLGFKNLGAETQVEISQHSVHQSLLISKDQPIFYDMKRNTSLQILSYYNLQLRPDENQFYLDFSFVEANSSSIKLEDISLTNLTNFKQTLSNKDFILENRTKAIRLKLSPNYYKRVSIDEKKADQQIWFKIAFKVVSKSHSYFSVVDRNIPFGEENFISLKDGQIFRSYMFDSIKSDQRVSGVDEVSEVQNFKVRVPSISTLNIMTDCNEFNQLQIQFYADASKITRISPKVYVENITNHNKKCSQLIHLNPTTIFGNHPNKDNQDDLKSLTELNQKGKWVYVKLTGINDEIDLLFSSSDMIVLENGFPYHSQLQYNQPIYFYAPYVKNQAIIKITKCSDCQLTITYSEEQLADLKAKRSRQILTQQVKSLNQFFTHLMKEKRGLYIKINTNNYAHFVINVQEAIDQGVTELLNPKQISNQVTFSLEDDDKLVLEFAPPQFIYVNNLNSPIHFNLIEGSIQVQVSREVYCPEFIFTQRQKTRDVSITPIIPELKHDEKGNEIMKFVMELKHHDFFGIRAQKGSQIFSYQVVNIESMKEFAQYRLSIFNVVLFLTFTVFMSFVCFMGLKRKRVRKIGGQVVLEQTDGEQTSMIRLN